MQQNKKIWILTDKRVGNANQARHLARLMGWDATEYFMQYSWLSVLPNRLLLGLYRITSEVRRKILNSAAPEIIISSGRRTAVIALAIKKICPKVKIVQIMHPELPIRSFDVVILPEHDRKPSLIKCENIVWIAGAVSYVEQDMLDKEEKKLRTHYDINPEMKICSMMIGGATGNRAITRTNIDEIMRVVLRYIEIDKVLLIISTSRRTSPDIVQYLTDYAKKSPNGRIIVHSYNYDSTYNPYWGMIAAASRVIVTADSISMCSEIISCGKQTFLYGRKNMLEPKHERFMQSLINAGLAKNLVFGMSNYTPNTIDQSKKIVGSVESILNR